MELLILLALLSAAGKRSASSKPTLVLKSAGQIVDLAKDGKRDVDLPKGSYEFVYQFPKSTFASNAAGKKRSDAITADLRKLDGFESIAAHRTSGLATFLRHTSRGLRFVVGSVAKIGGIEATLQRIVRRK